MDLFDAIDQRHSYRGVFKETAIPDNHLVKIVNAGIRAPSGCNAQTTDFVIITDKQKIEDIGLLLKHDYIKTAQAIIVCVVTKENVIPGASFEKEDCAAAVENMLLAITALGYATVWIDGSLRRDGRAKKIGAMINAPRKKQVEVILPVGVPVDKHEQKEKKPFDQRAWFDAYS